jgi:eukaryotic-like serine/threonine-protein kinase
MKTCASSGLVYPDESTFCFVTGDTLQATDDPLSGRTVAGRFRVDAKIADGPWARVFRGRVRLLDRPVVIKVFDATFAGEAGDEARRKFEMAVNKGRRCTHPNVVELLGGGVLPDGTPYIAHPAIEARRLDEAVTGAQTLEYGLCLVRQLLLGLSRVHDFGAVHGALRPSNILVTKKGHLEIIDVGLGRALLHDPWDDDPNSLAAQKYLAPELSSSARSSGPADVYAVGILAFQLLAGRLPYDAGNVSDLRNLVHAEGSLDLTEALGAVPDAIRSWLGAMIDRVPDRRPANPHQAVAELDDACAEAGVSVMGDPGAAPAPAALQLDPAFARWDRFLAIFNRMLESGFPQGAGEQERNGLAMIAGRIADLGEIGKKALYEHGVLEDVGARAREGRARVAEQMAELNVQAKEIRMEISPLRLAAERHGEKTRGFPQEALETHEEIVRWEGRFGFAEPYKELADAYRAMADLVEKWWSVRSAQLTCERDAAAKDERLHTIDGQLEELREALRIHEANLSQEVTAAESALAELGQRSDVIELELLDLASRFSAPLRSKPQLGPLFRELAGA